MTDADAEHKCHCPHVVVVVNDLKRLERLAWIFVVAVVGVLVHRVTNAMGAHEADAVSRGRDGERMGYEHIPKPEQ